MVAIASTEHVNKLLYGVYGFVVSTLLALFVLLPMTAYAQEPDDASAAPHTATEATSAATYETAIEENLVEACGIAFSLPEGAEESTIAKDRAVWRIPLADDGVLVVSARRVGWNGDEASIERYVNSSVASVAAGLQDAAVDAGGWGTYGDEIDMFASGAVDAEHLVFIAATPWDDENVSVLACTYQGSAVPDGALQIGRILSSITLADDPYVDESKRGELNYFDVIDVANLKGQLIVDLLEEGANFEYHASSDFTGWMSRDTGPFDAAGGCTAQLFTLGNGQGSVEPIATRELALSAEEISGIEVVWYGVPGIAWDEVSDIGRTAVRACKLTGSLDDGYTSDWGENGDYSWARVGRCQINEQDAYWLLQVESAGSGGTCTITLSCDLLANGHGGGFASYDELLDELFDW